MGVRSDEMCGAQPESSLKLKCNTVTLQQHGELALYHLDDGRAVWVIWKDVVRREPDHHRHVVAGVGPWLALQLLEVGIVKGHGVPKALSA